MRTQTRLPARLFFVLVVVIALSSGSRARNSTYYDSFYGFGDSLGDVGNILLLITSLGVNPPPPPSTSPHAAYYKGRFSNGPVAFEYLWELLTGQPPEAPGGLTPSVALPVLPPTGAVDFAFGGTGTGELDPLPGGLLSAPGLKGQVGLFRRALNGTTPSGHALYAIITGANDYLNPLSHQTTPEEVVGNIVESVASLYELGARDVMVVSLPDLGLLPLNGPAAHDLSQLTKQHNKLLKSSLHKLAARLKGLNLIEVDPNGVLHGGLPDGINTTLPALDAFFPPELFPPGFRMSLCLFIGAATCVDAPTFYLPAPGYLFWDSVHPTTDVHKLLGRHMYDAITH